MYVYLKNNVGEYIVGFFDPYTLQFVQEENSHTNVRSAAARVNYLNGGTGELSK